MKPRRFLIAAWLFLVTLAGPLPAADTAAPSDPQQRLDELWPGLTAEDQAARRVPEQQWQEFCFPLSLPGREADRTAACRVMAEKLVPGTPAPARIWLLKQLQLIGGAECVAAVAAQLDDADPLVCDAARRALAEIPVPEAGAKLRERLQSTPDAVKKAALIAALGDRAEEASVPVLGDRLSDTDSQVAEAAAKALGRIGTPAAATRLANARRQAAGPLRLQIGDACLRCADRLLAAGQTAEAAAIYRELNVPGEPARLAALKGVLRTAGDQAGAVVLAVLADDDPAIHRVAVQHVHELSGNAIRDLAIGWTKLPAEGQVRLLGALGTGGDPAGLPAVLAAVASDDADVRIAAIRALGGVGNAASLPQLIKIMQTGGDAGQAARGSIEAVWAEGADEALVDAMKRTEDPGQRAVLIEILERRRAVAAVSALLQEILHDDANVRRRAMSALGQLAGAEDVAGMLKGLIRSSEGGERDETEKAIAAVCARIPDDAQQVDVVVAVYQRSPDEQRAIILPVLGRIGSARALQTVRAAIASSDPREQDSGVRAICNWPDSAVSEDLLKLAESAADDANRIRALRALARVAVLPSDRSEESKLQLLEHGMRLAARDEERNLILDRAREARTVESARFAARFLDNPALAERASRTIVEVAHRREIREPNQQEFNQLLERVARTTKDAGLADRAKTYISP